MTTIQKTFQIRAYTTKQGYARIDTVLRDCARLYNAALQEWRDAYPRRTIEVQADKGKGQVYRDGEWRMAEAEDTDGIWFNQTSGQPIGTEPQITKYSQMRELTGIRKDDPAWGDRSLRIARGVLVRLDRARNAFYKRAKAGEKPGYPRFKSWRRWRSIEIDEPALSMVKESCAHIKGLPVIRVPSKRELPPSDRLTRLTLSRDGRRLTVNLTSEVERHEVENVKAEAEEGKRAVGSPVGESPEIHCHSGVSHAYSGADAPTDGGDANLDLPMGRALPGADAPQAVGIDMGVTDRMFLSTGESIPRRNIDREDIVGKQRRLSSAKRGSNNRRKRAGILANAHHRAKVRNRNECHRITTDLVRRFGLIAVEDLKIKNMTKSAKGTIENPGTNVAAKSGLNRSELEQTWGIIRQQLAYKAAWAGKQLVEVDARFTSQTCSRCGVIDAASRKDNRKHHACRHCGLAMDADHNAAINILNKALEGGDSPPRASHSAP